MSRPHYQISVVHSGTLADTPNTPLINKMTPESKGLLRRYRAGLGRYLKYYLEQGPQANLQLAQKIGRQAMTLGLETLGLARIHEMALVSLGLPNYAPNSWNVIVRRAGLFFFEAITPIEKTHRTARDANVRLNQTVAVLNLRSINLADSNRRLKKEVAHRKIVEESLRKSKLHYRELLGKSCFLQEQSRYLARKLLVTQEEERKRISRELHDEIAQVLTGINVRLATLKTEATINTKGLKKKISHAQRMVEKSVDVVHRFARELRPTVLDDLGLIPALQTSAKNFSKQNHIFVHLKVFSGVEQLSMAKRTVLYRVAQEALNNVVRHAQASRVNIHIKELPGAVYMEIKDNGKSFQVDHILHARKKHRLGLLGMRERIEMVGGSFTVKSMPGKGTTVSAQIPIDRSQPKLSLNV